MKFSFKNIRKHLIVAWGFSYLLVIAIMLTVTLMISFIYTSTSKKILNEFNDYIFKTVSRDVKDTLLSMNRMYLNVTSNSNLTSLLSSTIDPYDQEISHDFIVDLNSYEQYSENIDDFFVYNKSTDTVISSTGVFPANLYHSMFFNPEKISYEQWQKTIKDCNSRMLFTDIPFVNKDSRDINTIAMIFSIPHIQNDWIGVVLSDKTNFLEGLEDIKWDNLCDIYIYNSLGELVTYSKHSQDNIIPTQIKQLSKYNIEKNNMHISNIVVNTHSWQVVTIVSDNALDKSIVIAQTFIICIILASLVILFYAVKNILNKNYRPIKTMLSFFNITETTNEYEHLFASINSSLNLNRSLTKELDSSSKRLKELNLAKLLRGELAISPQEDYGFSFSGDYFSVLAFYIEDIQSLFSDEENMTNANKLSYLSFILDNVFSEIMEKKGITVYTTEIDEQVVCLLNSQNQISTEAIIDSAEYGREFINKSFDIKLTFSLSKTLLGVLNIPTAFSQAAEVLEHKRILGIEEPMHYIENSSVKSGYIFDLYKEQVLINSIKTGNSEAALEFLKQIFEEIENHDSLPFDYIVYVILDIACTITKAANSILPESIDCNESLVFYRKIKNGENLANLYLQMSEYINELCETIRVDISEGKNRTHFLVSHIEKYIADNYTDPNMSVYSIGTHFNIKPDYISKIFKKEVGKPLLTYITYYRLEKALELIKKGKYSKKEIVKMVGFTSERNFYRVLKKYEEENGEIK